MNTAVDMSAAVASNGSAKTLVPVRENRYEGLVMVTSGAEARRRLQEIQAFVASVMVLGVDYGVIPGTDKPTLFQPGAQKLAEVYGFSHEFVDNGSREDWDRPFFLFRKRCILVSRRDGSYVGDGIGSCNSREDRYAWRWVFDNELPKGADRSGFKAMTRQGKNGREYTKFRVPNEDVYSLVNTIEKMACKRAYVHAVLGVTRSGGLFTQDLEDLPPEVYGAVEDERPWEKAKEEPKVEPAKPAPAKGEPPRTRKASDVARELAERMQDAAINGDEVALTAAWKEAEAKPFSDAIKATLKAKYDEAVRVCGETINSAGA